MKKEMLSVSFLLIAGYGFSQEVISSQGNSYSNSNGSVELVNGTATVQFDATYNSLLGESPIVTVSPNGECNGVYVTNITKEGFTIKELNGGNHTVAISWIAVGNRVDNRMEEATQMVAAPEFDRNIQQVLFNDGIKEGKAMGIWWDGNQIQFGVIPEHLQPKGKK